MFRTAPLSIIRSFFTVNTAMVYVIQVCWQLASKFYSKNKFEKLVHPVGFIIRSAFIIALPVTMWPTLLYRYSNPITGRDRSWGFQEFKTPRFKDPRQGKIVVRLAVLRTIGKRTQDLPACTAVPQPNASPRTPSILWDILLQGQQWCLSPWSLDGSVYPNF